jgi:hypothetical protein
MACSCGFWEAWQGVQGRQRPLADLSARGPMRAWRTLAWLFLGGLRPRRAHLRFTKHGYYSAQVAGKKLRSQSLEETSCVVVRFASALFLIKKKPSWTSRPV